MCVKQKTLTKYGNETINIHTQMALKKGKLRPDAVPTTFIHRPKPKRRKTPLRMMASAEVKTPDDHTYCIKLNLGMIPVNTVFPQFFPFHVFQKQDIVNRLVSFTSKDVV